MVEINDPKSSKTAMERALERETKDAETAEEIINKGLELIMQQPERNSQEEEPESPDIPPSPRRTIANADFNRGSTRWSMHYGCRDSGRGLVKKELSIRSVVQPEGSELANSLVLVQVYLTRGWRDFPQGNYSIYTNPGSSYNNNPEAYKGIMELLKGLNSSSTD